MTTSTTDARRYLPRHGTALLLLVSLSACVHSAPPAGAAAAPPDKSGMMMAMCPMSVPGTQVYAADTANGEALTFTAAPAQVAELRIRVHAMANMHNQHHGDLGGQGTGATKPPPSSAWVEDVENGARIAMTPTDPADLLKLQSAVRMHAAHLQQHGCSY